MVGGEIYSVRLLAEIHVSQFLWATFMRSGNISTLVIFSCALFFIISPLVGCDSDQSPSAAQRGAPSVSDETISENVDADNADANNGDIMDGEEKLLTIGSKAPSLDIEHWLSDGHGRFPKVKEFEAGNVYVVEFWATWCGPCIRSMPHLAQTQETYADQNVQIISISDEEPSVIEDFLKRDYRGGEQDGPATYRELTSVYCLATDPDSSVNIDYMKAAGQNGIPCAFIVGKSGLVEWIGHPMGMDETLTSVVDDKWDRAMFADAFKEKQNVDRLMQKVMRLAKQGKVDEAKEVLSAGKKGASKAVAPMLEQIESMLVMMPLQNLMRAKKFEEAIDKIQELRQTVDGESKEWLDTTLIKLLVQQNQDEKAIATLNSAAKNLSPELVNAITWAIYERAVKSDEVPEGLRDAAIAATEQAVEAKPDEGAILDTLAHLIHLTGDLDRAIEIQTEALAKSGSGNVQIAAFLKQLQQEKESLKDRDEAKKENAEN